MRVDDFAGGAGKGLDGSTSLLVFEVYLKYSEWAIAGVQTFFSYFRQCLCGCLRFFGGGGA